VNVWVRSHAIHSIIVVSLVAAVGLSVGLAIADETVETILVGLTLVASTAILASAITAALYAKPAYDEAVAHLRTRQLTQDELKLPVSQENVEVVRRAVEAANRRPKPDFDVVNALYDPNHMLVAQLSGVEGETFRGARGFREWLTNMDRAFEWVESRVERVTEIDDQRVLVVQTLSLRSRLADVPIELDLAAIVTVRDGRIVRTENYRSVGQALQAADLSE
jgi:ketosteroid isomerase-like protein